MLQDHQETIIVLEDVTTEVLETIEAVMTENQERQEKKINSLLTYILKSPSKFLMGFFLYL
jgi:hypothetical protein